MARVVRLVSDISGTEANEDEFTKLVVRSHVATEEPKQLDILKSEAEALKGADNLVQIEVGENGNKRELVMPLADFRKLVKDETVKAAPGTRGRRPGFSPGSKS